MTFMDTVRLSIASMFTKTVKPGLFGFFNPQDLPRMNEKEAAKAYRGWVFACTNAIANRISDIDLVLQKKNKDDEWETVKKADKIPAMQVLYHVNDYMSFTELMFATAAWQELNGNSFWYVPRAGKTTIGPPNEIWTLDPTKTQVVKDSKEFIKGYVFRNDVGDPIPLECSEVVHFHRFNSMSKYRGMGTVEAAGLAIDTDTYAAEWQRNFFGNSAMPSALLSTEGTLSDEQYGRIRANWDAKYKGVQNAHKMAIMEGGIKFTPLNPTMKEMDYSGGRLNLRNEICGIFGVPLPVLGVLDTANLASADAADMLFAKNTIKPKMRHFVESLTEYWLPLFGMDITQYRMWFADPVPENKADKRAERESGIKNTYMTPNEARAQIGQKPLPGGDDLLLPPGYTPLSQYTPYTPTTPVDNTPEGTKAMRKRIVAKRISKKRQFKIDIKATGKKRNEYIDAQVKIATAKFQALNEKLKNLILTNAKTKAAKSVYKKDHKATGAMTAMASKMGLVDKDNQTANDLVQILFSNYNEWVGLVYNATKEGMTKVLGDSGKMALAQVKVDIDFDLKNPRAQDWINGHALEDTTSYTDNLKADIGQVIHDGVGAGESIDDITTSIGVFFDGQSDYRAERIARTETGNAYSQGSLEGYKQSGVVSGKEWLADDSACDTCMGNEDEGVIPLNDNFASGHDAPTAHPNCECALQPVVEGDTG